MMARKPTAHHYSRGYQEAAARAAIRVLQPLFGHKEGALEARLIAEWREIAGAETATRCWPRAVHFRGKNRAATCELLTDDAYITELSYAKDMLIEKVALYFGFRAVADFTFRATHQLPGISAPLRTRRSNLPKNAAEYLHTITDPTLRDALAKFLQ